MATTLAENYNEAMIKGLNDCVVRNEPVETLSEYCENGINALYMAIEALKSFKRLMEVKENDKCGVDHKAGD